MHAVTSGATTLMPGKQSCVHGLQCLRGNGAVCVSSFFFFVKYLIGIHW